MFVFLYIHWISSVVPFYSYYCLFVLPPIFFLISFARILSIILMFLQHTPVFFPGQFHGQKSLASCSLQGRKESDTTKRLTHTHIGIRNLKKKKKNNLKKFTGSERNSSHLV